MGFRQALAGRNRGIEARALEKSAKRKSLFSSIGKTVGGIAATAITGGAAAPWAAGLMAGAGSFVGGAVGSGVGGKVQGGSFFREEAADLNKDLGAFGEENITSALKSGLTAGIGQKLKLAKEGAPAPAKGLDFKGSFVGKGLEEARIAAIPIAEEVALSSEAQRMISDPKGTMKSFQDITAAGDEAKLSEFLRGDASFATEFGTGGGSVKKPLATSLDWRHADVKQTNWAGGHTGGIQHRGTGSGQSVAQELGDKFYSENVFGVGDKAGEVIPISEATPRTSEYADMEVTSTSGNRETGEYFFEDSKKQTLWDKVVDFVDVSDTNEARAIESQLSQYPGNMQAYVPKESWQKKLGLYTGYGSEGYRPTTWTGETELQKGFDQYKTFKDTKVDGIPEWRME